MIKFARKGSNGRKVFEYGTITPGDWPKTLATYEVLGTADTLDEAIQLAGMSEVHPNVKRGINGYDSIEKRHSKESIEKAARQKQEQQSERKTLEATPDGEKIAVRPMQKSTGDQQLQAALGNEEYEQLLQ